MEAVEMYDWKKVEMHYAQYSPEELEEMCSPDRLPNGMTRKEFEAAIRESYQGFLAESQNDVVQPVRILSIVMERIRNRAYDALQKFNTWIPMKMEPKNG